MGTGDWEKMFPEPELLGKYFHEQYKILPEHQRRKSDWKKGKITKVKEKRRANAETSADVSTVSGPSDVELPSNASGFAVFASVRLAVLDRWMKQACQIYLSSSSSTPVDGSEIESDSDETIDKTRDALPMRVPKIVGVGIRSVFELIRESRSSHPVLCTKALTALLDVVQGLQPEGLKSEPVEVIDPLFDLLLDLATSHGPESAAANDGRHLTAVACACLLSLVVVRGDTGKLLNATAALLMSPRVLSLQNIHMPAVLTALQRSVHGVLLGKVVRPDWITHGVPRGSRVDSFQVVMHGVSDMHSLSLRARSLASDGQFIYLYSSKGIFKIGSGYGATIKGHVYLHKSDFYLDENGWLGFANGMLYFICLGKVGCELLVLDRDSLKVKEIVMLEGKDWGSCIMFSDGENLGMISAKDDSFVVRMVNPNSPVVPVNELLLKLARKCVDVFGLAAFDEDAAIHTLNVGCNEEIATIVAGKEFGLIRTNSGKVLYCGKSASLGIKQGGLRNGKWAELPITKSPKVVHIATGHESLHAIMLAEDGSVFFVGTARRGEDGDQSKARRQPKPVKPKKMIKVDGQSVVHAACNNGTTALVNREGELIMFGKDTAHCDAATGLVGDLKDVHISAVALGKAHTVALTNRGHVYTFGINNKGQCGREFAVQVKEVPMVVAMETAVEEEGDDEELDWEDAAHEVMCSAGKHKWKHTMCMVCTVCRECTGYSISCLSSMRPDRNPGQECGCGEGDSGCSECGCCRICAKENVDNSDLAILGPSGAGDLAGMMRLDLIFGGRHGARLQDHLQRRLDERKQRQRGKLAGVSASKHCGLKMKGSSSRAGPSSAILVPTKLVASTPIRNLVVPATSNAQADDAAGNSEVDRDASRVTSLSPARVHIPSESAVAQISTGLHHTVLLLQNGEVYTFGSNTYGQLGVGDLVTRGGPTLVKMPCGAANVAAGSNHTAILTLRGEVYTFGNYQKGQLGRPSPVAGQEGALPGNSSGRRDTRSSRDGPWYSYPVAVPGIGPKHGRKATWVGASGDQTFMKIDESLINSLSLKQSTVMANKSCIVLLPTESNHTNNFKCLVINKRDGNCNSFGSPDQVDFTHMSTCLDPIYNILWSYNSGNHEMTCYNAVAAETRASMPLPLSILSPELALPVVASCFVTRSQAALHLLSCLDTLTQAQNQRLTMREDSEDRQSGCGKVYSREDFSAVTRFESHGGGWGYSGHSIEAVRFMADTDILLGGFGLFGGRGEYTGKIKLYDIGIDGGEQETDGELLAETEEIPYECGPRQKYPMLFEEPVALQSNRWYVAWSRVSGPSSDCGSSGQGMVTTEDQVVFYFKSSKKSNNGTDVNAGQIPQLLYRVVTPESQTPNRQTDQTEPVYILSREFSRGVTRECFQSIIALLQWSWNTFKASLVDVSFVNTVTSGYSAALLDLDRLVYISRASLRLLRTYTNEIYPNQVGSKKLPTESVRLAECVGDVRALLRQILSDQLPVINVQRKTGKIRQQKATISNPYPKMITSVLEECHETFVSSFHAFYPTAFLKWTCLCDLLASMDKGGSNFGTSDRLLSAVLAALGSPTVRLRSTFPILSSVLDASDSSLKRQLSPSDNTGLPMMPCVDSHHYPILVEQMSYRSQLEGNAAEGNWLFREVLERLLDVVTLPVQQALCQEKVSHSPELVRNCCHLLARVVGELATQSSGTDEDLQGACGRILHTTGSRFTRTNQSRSWNTGNGSPDAVCLSVDRPGIAIAGACVYGGAGSFEYELELLDDQNHGSSDPSHNQRWTSLELVRGTFGPEECVADVAEIKFERPVPVKENVKYAVRLRNHGGRTSNGDGGLNSVKGPDGTTFSFSTCSLSFNGTTQTRGQIPQVLYYSNPQDSDSQQTSKAWAEMQACKCTLTITSAIMQRCNDLMALARERAEDLIATEVLGSACIVTTLLPLLLAHISPLATLDPRSGVQVLNMVQELLPHVAALNLLSYGMHHSTGSVDSVGNHDTLAAHQPSTNTTSHHYAWVESEHPYKPATVSNYRVSFPESVKWTCIEFDAQCGTAQSEDSLQLYIPSLSGGPPVPAKRVGAASPAASEDTDNDSAPAPYWPMLHKFSRNNWPQTAVVLPGNEVIFSLETASDYVKDEKACFYGFRCLVIGYEWQSNVSEGLKHLETELAYLGGMCAASLMKKDLLLPPASAEEMDEDVDIAEEIAQQVYNTNAALLGKGFALANAPSISQALDGVLPFSCHSNERLFLKDFVHCVAGTSGGRLSRWLQPDSYVEPARCEALYSREDMRCGWPAIVTILTKDQYGEVVHTPNLKIEVKAVPIDKKELGDLDQGRKMRRISQPDPLTFGGRTQPSLDTPYEVTVKDKMCYHAVTFMKVYEDYSFEELRYTSPAVKRSSENMLVRPNGDGTYSATWTPGSVGWYSVLVTIDSYEMEEVYKVEVKEPPQGITPPTQSIVKKAMHQPSRLRKFVAKNSAGLRIRAHPSLQSEQIGIVHVDGTIAFIDEIHNDDGVWLRLNHHTIAQYCNCAHGEAWCLQYNQHLGKTLLLPVEEPKTILDQVMKDTISRNTPEPSEDRRQNPNALGQGEYTVVKCGASGHNVRSMPSLKAAPVGMLVLGNQVGVSDHLVNADGTWVQLDDATKEKFCFNMEGEAWSLALNKLDVVYIRKDWQIGTDFTMDPRPQIMDNSYGSPRRGFDFSLNTNGPASFTPVAESSGFTFSSPIATSRDVSQPGTAGSTSSNPFVFGSFSQSSIRYGPESPHPFDKSDQSPKPSMRERNRERDREKERESSKFSALQKWLKGEEGRQGSGKQGSSGRSDLPSEFVGVSVKDLVKAIGESRANGNGVTPPGTPQRCSRSSSPKAAPGASSSPRLSRSSSPVAIPGQGIRATLYVPAHVAGNRSLVGLLQHDSASSSPRLSPLGGHRPHLAQFATNLINRSPSVSGGLADSQHSPASQRRGSTQSDTSAHVSSLTRDLSQSPSGGTTTANTRDLSPSPSCSSLQMRSEGSPTPDPLGSPKAVTQTGTQTSPESASVKSHFSIGAKDERLSPKLGRKDRTGSKGRSKRAMSPAPPQQPSTSRERVNPSKPVKEAVSPSVAESLRAIFAAFLWHEGIVHDAMACASFLKFHPTLPKQGALVVTRQTPSSVDKKKPELTKEQRARQRHSLEVTTAGNYLQIQPSTLESLTRSAANANANRNRTKKHADVIKEETGPVLSTLPETTFSTVAVLPPALKSLVFLWEELSVNCRIAIMQQVVFPSPTVPVRTRKLERAKASDPGKEPNGVEPSTPKKASRKKKEWKPLGRANLLADCAGGLAGAALGLMGGAGDRETACELCGNMFPHPVTYHMRQAHPGCGGHAGGKGYNSGGNFCVGWAGNCGDGGVGGSSWYLVCDTCREKYLRSKKINCNKDKNNKKQSLRKKCVTAPSVKVLSPTMSSMPLETHLIMKNNAMFLLDLASAAVSSYPQHHQGRRRESQSMPSVAENYSPPEPQGPFCPAGPFQCLQALGMLHSRDEQSFVEETLRRQNSNIEAGFNGNCIMEDSNFRRQLSESPLSDNESESSKGRAFHRSVSMGTNGAPWSRREGDGRVIMMRKRNNSSGEMPSDAGSSLLCYPSAALQKLVPSLDQSVIVSCHAADDGGGVEVLARPVLAFLLQQHNLEALQLAMRQALRKATCRVYAMQAFNWLLRSVTQPTCLHDLLWWFVSALTPVSPEHDFEPEDEASNKLERKDENLDLRGVCEHPLSDISIAGEAVHPLPSTFHTLLQTIADLMLVLPMGSALQQMAVRCWGLRFTQADHMFLHRSHVFSNISKILSRSEEETDETSISMHESHQSTYSQLTSCVETLKDLTPNIDIKASSRQAMVASLTDNSTETFWESGDEDRNKTKTITLICPPQSYPRMIYIHIDNCRDLANKVSSVTFQSGPNLDELYKLRLVDVENRSTGWVSCPVLDARYSVVRLEMKGPDNSLRLRQIRVLGEIDGETLQSGRQHSVLTIQQRNCETETLRVFRLITSQVFGKLIMGEVPVDGGEAKEGVEESNDLKEHMVGILFSRSKLTHLQKQVCVHIVQAIRKEATRVREEWESLLCSAPTPTPSAGSSGSTEAGKTTDTYCFEMLSMVLALSGSSVGRAYLSHQYGLLRDLLSLLHTGSARVQRQVTSLLRRMLPEVSPSLLGSVMSVDQLPPLDFSIVSTSKENSPFDMHRVGILDVFLSCIAKALTVQVKVKGKDGKGLTTVSLATSIHPRDYVGCRWWLRGCITRKLAEVIIQLMKDMAAGKLSEQWATVTKSAVAENILNLTKLDEGQRSPAECLHTPTLWLALASLCVLDSEHVERLSSGQWSGAVDGQPAAPRVTCSNHDDGETSAIIQCNTCGNLCADCDRFLHLHRRTRMHLRQVCKEEEEAIKVDLHEGCGRTKLFWVMALADSCTLKAMVEFREGNRNRPAGVTSGTCRFCGITGNSGLLAIGNICADHECQEHARHACSKFHACGHMCGGIKGEAKCLPCLHGCSGNRALKQDADDMCMICFTEALSCAPAVQLKCGHVFHLQCCRCVLMKRWAGPRITFAFSQCPICKSNIEHPVLRDLLSSVNDLYEDVRRKALMRLEYEGLHKAEAISSPGARFYNDPASYAMDRYAYYVCYKCNKAYYGGEARCDVEMGGDYDPTELVCGGCSDVSRAQMCPKHGTDFLEYKCRYCCSTAVFFCFGTTHFCNACHDDFQRVTNIPRLELPNCPAGPKAKQLEGDECPLHVKHPATGEEFALGCGVCRNAHTF